MLTVATIWWLFFWTAVGLCVGSFLNCVVFRLPRSRSLSIPLWSYCPHCRNRIRWYDNIPVLSFLLLGGRCRDCSVPIATRYVVIEIASALLVLGLLDAFFIGQVREGLTHRALGLTEQLANDWPIFVAHLVLFACLLAMSAIDLEHYWVDVRFTNMIALTGFGLHMIWTPRHSADWIRPHDTMAVMSIFALFGLVLVWLVSVCQPDTEADEMPTARTAPLGNGPVPVGIPAAPPPSLSPPSRLAGIGAALLLALLAGALFLEATDRVDLRYAGRAWPAVLFFFMLILSENTVSRSADDAIIEAIHEERHAARRMVLDELLLLLPAVGLGLAGFWLMSGGGELPERVARALHAELTESGTPLVPHWAPLQGLATAASGYIVAGAVGWGVRIFFTLVFGKEAFGAGDIHMMAAAGCVAGWPVVLIGFFLCCPLALLGWSATLPFKRTRAVPLGPWLALSFFVVVLFYEPILELPPVARMIEAGRFLFLHNSQALPLGVVS